MSAAPEYPEGGRVAPEESDRPAPIRVLLAVGNPERERRLRDALAGDGMVIADRCLDAVSLVERAAAMDLDVALASSDLHRLTATYRFGGVTEATRGSSRRPYIDTAPEREALEERQPRQQRDLQEPLIQEPRRRPRPTPRDERPAGVQGWIY